MKLSANMSVGLDILSASNAILLGKLHGGIYDTSKPLILEEPSTVPILLFFSFNLLINAVSTHSL